MLLWASTTYTVVDYKLQRSLCGVVLVTLRNTKHTETKATCAQHARMNCIITMYLVRYKVPHFFILFLLRVMSAYFSRCFLPLSLICTRSYLHSDGHTPAVKVMHLWWVSSREDQLKEWFRMISLSKPFSNYTEYFLHGVNAWMWGIQHMVTEPCQTFQGHFVQVWKQEAERNWTGITGSTKSNT